MSSKMIYNRPLPVQRISDSIADKAQRNTQHYGKRPYGVGLLIAGYDEQGPHLFEFVSSGTVLAYRATAIGARSQSARTYLERNVDALATASKEDLILHGLRALRDSLAQDKELTTANTSIALVGEDQTFKVMEGEELVPWLEKLGDVSMTAVRQREAAVRNAPTTQEAEMTETTPVAAAASTETQEQAHTQAENAGDNAGDAMEE
jgi:20S proteasome subunit alpha 6